MCDVEGSFFLFYLSICLNEYLVPLLSSDGSTRRGLPYRVAVNFDRGPRHSEVVSWLAELTVLAKKDNGMLYVGGVMEVLHEIW